MDERRATPEPTTYVTLKEAESQASVSRVTLKRYMSRLGIEPISFHVRNRSLYIRREELEKIKKLKQDPTLLEQLRGHHNQQDKSRPQ